MPTRSISGRAGAIDGTVAAGPALNDPFQGGVPSEAAARDENCTTNSSVVCVREIPMKKTAEGSVNNKEIILFALYELGAAQNQVHTEDVAHKVFQYPIGKQKYRWEKYEMYPDKERIARELRWLKKWQGVSYVKGHVNIGARGDRIDGWTLTAAGVEHVKQIEQRMRKVVEAEAGTHSIYKADEVRKRIVSSACYKLYKEDPSLSNAEDHHFTDMLYCLPDAPYEKIRAAFDALLGSAKAVEAKDMVEFLESARARFHRLLEK